jgi:sec-independent protein translocase protein TatC
MPQNNSIANAPPPPSDDGMTMIDHLVELRKRLTVAVYALLPGFLVGSFLVFGPPQLVDVIITAFAPLSAEGGATLQGVGTAETFVSFMMVAFIIGIILAMPVIVYELIAFIAPGLNDIERRYVLIALPVVTLFFLAGVAFGWFVTVPAAIHFLIGFSGSELIEVKPAVSDFLRTVTMLLLMNGIVFEMPVIIYILAILGLTTAQQLSKYRRYAVVIVTIIAAIITPTGDPINLLLLAIPMYFLFEFGIILARLAPNRQQTPSDPLA